MFYIQGEVISDQFYDLKFIYLESPLFIMGKKREVFGISPIRKSKCQNIGKILTRLGLFITPKCVKSQNQLPIHTMKTKHFLRAALKGPKMQNKPYFLSDPGIPV